MGPLVMADIVEQSAVVPRPHSALQAEAIESR